MSLRIIHTFMLLSAIAAYGQVLISSEAPGRPVHLIPSDAAILESPHARADLSCAVKPITPHLDFDLKFHSGFTVALSLQDLAGSGNRLTSIFRVIADDQPEEPVYFSQEWTVPAIAEDSKGKAELQGFFALGEGRYHVEWLLRDRSERICSHRWALVINPRSKDKPVRLALPHSTVEPDSVDPYLDEAPVKRDGPPLKLLVLFHAAPQFSGAITIRKEETLALLAILRQISQEPRIGAYSMVAFNLDQGSVLYRDHDTTQIDFAALGNAVRKLQLGTVDVQNLREKGKPAEFLGRLISEEVARSRPDALVFVGPRMLDPAAISRSIKNLGEPNIPVFYLNYTADPKLNPWRDLIGTLVRLWKGTEYTISKPPDLFAAWTEVMSRITRKTNPPGGTDPALALTDPVHEK
jgi:hypothetical protein